jgi:2-oxo-3-(phosphooxy)propyl 3-oxoalkanoate synthase
VNVNVEVVEDGLTIHRREVDRPLPTAASAGAEPRLPTPRDAATVDRTLLHRKGLGEVFLTDARRTADDAFEVYAQLPRAHTYYTDHPGRVECVDPLLLLECCRQAETLVAHRFLGVPLGTHFILRSWGLALDGPCWVARGSVPEVLRFAVRLTDERRLAGSLRSARLVMEIARIEPEAAEVGTLSMDVSYAEPAVYQVLRGTGGLPARPLTSDDLRTRPAPAPVDPVWVGRSRLENVLLSGIEADANGLRGHLRLPFTNTSMFDHAQDHVPAMVLTDAARQLALFGLAEMHGVSTPHTVLVRLQARFDQYVELDQPAQLRLITVSRPCLAGISSTASASVEVHQSGGTPALLNLALATYPGLATRAEVQR